MTKSAASETDTLIDMLRHGEPVGGRAYRGNSIDDPLTDKGWEQMRRAINGFDDWDVIATSPLQRCLAFAEELAQNIGLEVTVEPSFREVGFGEWEGRVPDEIIKSNREEYEAFYQDPENCRPEGAEPLQDFTDRVIGAYEELVRKNSGKHLLIVTHAGVMRAIIAHVLGAPPVGMYRIKVENAGITRIRHTRYGPKLELHNAGFVS